MDVASVCSGVGGIDLGFERAGMRTVGLCEWDAKCQDVLRKHWPDVVIRGDIATVKGNRGAADLVAGGTPCQDLSVAGRRAGLDGERSSLFFDFVRLISEIGPEWIVWENVPGALTSGRGRDMGTVLGTLADLGYGVAYRVLDARFFGVAQRRRRVILVGRRGDVGSAAEVLALGESVRGNPPARPATRPVLAAVAQDGPGGSDPRDVTIATFRKSRRAQSAEDFETWVEDDFANTLNVADNTGDVRATTLMVGPRPGTLGWSPEQADLPVSVFENQRAEVRADVVMQSLNAGGGKPGQGYPCIVTADPPLGVRRLTPRECERLQGFPDDWTAVGASGKVIADSHRYRMMGNSVAVPVFEWLGKRIMTVANRAQAVA